LLLLPGDIEYGRVCLLVGSFVRDARYDFSENKSPIFMKFGADVQQRRQRITEYCGVLTRVDGFEKC